MSHGTPPKIVRSVAELRAATRQARRDSKVVGFVPTMGALHRGHLRLVEVACEHTDVVVVSIFVNPTQFAPTEDLDSYPSTPEADHAGCEARGVDAIFAPTAATMYPDGAVTEVQVPALARHLCGRDRPIHFAGPNRL